MDHVMRPDLNHGIGQSEMAAFGMDTGALPLLRKQAGRFLNWDLMTRVNAPFNNFYSACNSNGSQLTDCIVWDSQIAVHSGNSAARTFTIADMSGGCGNGHGGTPVPSTLRK